MSRSRASLTLLPTPEFQPPAPSTRANFAATLGELKAEVSLNSRVLDVEKVDDPPTARHLAVGNMDRARISNLSGLAIRVESGQGQTSTGSIPEFGMLFTGRVGKHQTVYNTQADMFSRRRAGKTLGPIIAAHIRQGMPEEPQETLWLAEAWRLAQNLDGQKAVDGLLDEAPKTLKDAMVTEKMSRTGIQKNSPLKAEMHSKTSIASGREIYVANTVSVAGESDDARLLYFREFDATGGTQGAEVLGEIKNSALLANVKEYVLGLPRADDEALAAFNARVRHYAGLTPQQ